MKKFLVALFVILASQSYGLPMANQRHVLVLKLSQTHYTLDIWEHVKDAGNAVTIEIPVDQDFYDSVKVGQNILTNNFRVGSFFVRGSVGTWNLVVQEKR